jgi:NADH-quinone oxidoreductase subunit L
MTWPLVILAACSIIGGWVGIPHVFVADAHILAKFLAPVVASQEVENPAVHLSHEMELALMAMVLGLILLIVFIASRMFRKSAISENTETGVSGFLANKWYVDELYNAIIVKPLNALSSFLSRIIDNKIIDGCVNGVGRLVQFSGRQLRFLQSGQVGSYILIMVISLILFFIFQLYWKF